MKICDWLFPWRAKRYLEESDKLHSQLLSSLQSLTDQLTNLQIERQKLVDTYDKLQESYKDQITDITTMFHVEQSKLNEALSVAHENNKRVLGEKFGLLDEERESLTKRAVSAEEALKVSKEETVAEQRKIRALERWIKNVHRLDNEATEGTLKRIMQQSAMAIKLFFIIGIMLMTSCVVAQQPPILRTFFDTNPAPIVDVVGGVGITVTPSTPNVQTRRFAVDATGSTVASNIYGSNVIGPVNLAISATNWIGMNVFSNQVYLDITNYVNGNRDNTPAYVRSTFPENTNILLIQYSLDGDTWASITADGSAVWTNTLEVGTGVVLRDPSIMYDPVTSQFYVAFTHRFVPGVDPNGFTKYFGLISSSNLLNWYPVGTGLVPVITTNGQVFAPEWYQEGGTNFIIYSLNISWIGIGETHCTWVYGGNFTNWPLSTNIANVAYDGCISRRSNIWYLWVTDSGIIPELYTNWYGVVAPYTHAKTGIEQPFFEGPNVIPWYGGWRMYYSASDHGECFYTTNNDPLTLYDATASTNRQVEIPTNTVDHGTTFACTGDAKTKLLAAVCNRFNSTNTVLRGTVYANIAGVAYLASNQTFTGDNKFLGNYNVMRNLDVTNLDGAVDIPLRVRGPWDQSENLQSWSTGSTAVAFMTAGGNFFAYGFYGNGANLTNLTTQRQTFQGYVLEPGGISAGDVVGYQGSGYISQTDIGIVKAKNNDQNTLPVLGVAYGSGPFGSLVTVVMYGDVVVNSSTFFNGDYAYLGNSGNISAAPTDPNALIVQVGVITWADVVGHLHVDIKPRYDSYSGFEQPAGNLSYTLLNPLNIPDSGAAFVTRNSSNNWGSIGINNRLKVTNPDSQVINNSGIPMLFQIASNTAVTIDTGGNVGIGHASPQSRLYITNAASYFPIEISTNGGSALYMNPDGRIGLRTSTPRYNLDIPNGEMYANNHFGGNFIADFSSQYYGNGAGLTNLDARGLKYEGKDSFYTNFTATIAFQIYNCNGSNQVITLPNASTYPWQIFRFSSTNGYGSFILTNATGAQTIRDGTSLFLKNIGVGELGVYSDGSAWWIASKAKTVFPNASWSCSTNIPLATGVGSSNIFTYDTLEFNNSQGIALANGRDFWITNAGQYFFTFSAVCAVGNAGDTNFIWIKQNGTNMPRTRTDVILGKTATINHQVPMTVNFIFNITAPTFFQIVGRSSGASSSLVGTGSDATMPAMPSIIVTINRISDTYP